MKKRMRLMPILMAIMMVFTMMPLISQTAYADNPDVTYLDEKGETKTLKGADYKVVSGGESITLGTDDKDTWYVVKENETVNIENDLLLKGNVNLVLCNGSTLNAKHGIGNNLMNSFTIYAQSADENTMGGLTTHDGIRYGNVTINGGKVEIEGYCGIDGFSNVTINGGVVTATGEDDKSGIISEGDNNGAVRINGGKVIASGGAGAISGTVINSISGTAWTNTEGTKGKTDIPVSTGASLSSDYKKVQFPAEYPLWVGDKQVTSVNAANITGSDPVQASYDADSNTLTLNNFTYEGYGADNDDVKAAIKARMDDDFTIILNGDNTVKHVYKETSAGAGLYADNNMTITGDGTLTVSDGDNANNYNSRGIRVLQELTIASGATVNAASSKG